MVVAAAVLVPKVNPVGAEVVVLVFKEKPVKQQMNQLHTLNIEVSKIYTCCWSCC